MEKPAFWRNVLEEHNTVFWDAKVENSTEGALKNKTNAKDNVVKKDWSHAY